MFYLTNKEASTVLFTDLTNYEDYNNTTTAFPESNTCNLNLHIVTRMLAIYVTGGWGG